MVKEKSSYDEVDPFELFSLTMAKKRMYDEVDPFASTPDPEKQKVSFLF